jgi:PIN domain nuclease of toxin-antitoxin system
MIHILLDTNVVLWLAEDNHRADSIKSILLTTENRVFISVVSWWEIAIKIKSGKLNLNIKELYAYAKRHDFVELPLTGDCLKAYLELPNIHKDPFEHMLLAQALTFPMRLITGDSLLADYSSLVMVI